MKLEIVLDCFAMGFELDLYIPTEYTVMYGYLQFLYSQAQSIDVEVALEELSISKLSKQNLFYKDLCKYHHIQELMCHGSFYLSSLVQRSAKKREQPFFNFTKYYQNRFQYLGMLSSPALLQPSQYIQMELQNSRLPLAKLILTCAEMFKMAKAEITGFKPRFTSMKKVLNI
jgi:hypothetical protein